MGSDDKMTDRNPNSDISNLLTSIGVRDFPYREIQQTSVTETKRWPLLHAFERETSDRIPASITQADRTGHRSGAEKAPLFSAFENKSAPRQERPKQNSENSLRAMLRGLSGTDGGPESPEKVIAEQPLSQLFRRLAECRS